MLFTDFINSNLAPNISFKTVFVTHHTTLVHVLVLLLINQARKMFCRVIEDKVKSHWRLLMEFLFQTVATVWLRFKCSLLRHFVPVRDIKHLL